MLEKTPFPKNPVIAIILIAAFLFGVLLAFLGSALAGSFIKNKSTITIKPSSTPVNFTKATPAPVNSNNPQKGVYNVLLLGYGGAGHDGALLTDSIIVIHVDTNNHKADMI